MAIDVPETGQMIQLGKTQPWPAYLRDLWGRREFAVFVPYHDLRVQKMNTVLGQLWHFLNPAVTFVVYYLIFEIILKINRGNIDNYAGFLVVGILLFTTTNRVATDAVKVLETNVGLIRSIDFPRSLLPISSVIGQTMAFLPAVPVLIVALYLTGESVSLRWLLVPGIVVAQFLINVGIGLLMARAGFSMRDLTQILNHIFRLLFYGSGILFRPEDFISNELVVRLFALNPIYDVLAVARWALMDMPVTSDVVVGLFAWSIILPLLGMWVFVQAEHRYGG